MKSSILVLASILVVGCSSGAVDPSTNTDSQSDAGPAGPSVPASGSSDPSSGTGSPSAPGTGSGGTTDDAGTAPPSSGDDAGGGTITPPATTGVFADAGAYKPTLGPSARNPKHTGNPNPAGQACLSCHGGQRPNITPFLFAGTVWNAAAATTPLPQAEVRIVEANGTALSAFTDNDGNFFFTRAQGGTLAPPAHAGVRDANATMEMQNVFNDGDCNSCHRQGGEAPVNLP